MHFNIHWWAHRLLLKMMLVTFSKSTKESAPIRWMLFPVIIRVFTYPGKLCGKTCKLWEMHFTVRVTTEHVQLPGHSEQRWPAKNRTPKNTLTAIRTHMLDEQQIKMLKYSGGNKKIKLKKIALKQLRRRLLPMCYTEEIKEAVNWW